MKHTYRTNGTCSRSIEFDLEGDVVKNVVFQGGCNGNLQGISRAAEGMTVDRLHELFSGIHCGMKHTSCPDQLARAVAAAYEEEREDE
jgi:uncharacterized protein (TIGR03905 family)